MLETYTVKVTVSVDALDVAEAVTAVQEAIREYNNALMAKRKPQRVLLTQVASASKDKRR